MTERLHKAIVALFGADLVRKVFYWHELGWITRRDSGYCEEGRLRKRST